VSNFSHFVGVKDFLFSNLGVKLWGFWVSKISFLLNLLLEYLGPFVVKMAYEYPAAFRSGSLVSVHQAIWIASSGIGFWINLAPKRFR
jgi:hypothetical protein